jgi:hypothetical protein
MRSASTASASTRRAARSSAAGLAGTIGAHCAVGRTALKRRRSDLCRGCSTPAIQLTPEHIELRAQASGYRQATRQRRIGIGQRGRSLEAGGGAQWQTDAEACNALGTTTLAAGKHTDRGVGAALEIRAAGLVQRQVSSDRASRCSWLCSM